MKRRYDHGRNSLDRHGAYVLAARFGKHLGHLHWTDRPYQVFGHYSPGVLRVRSGVRSTAGKRTGDSVSGPGTPRLSQARAGYSRKSSVYRWHPFTRVRAVITGRLPGPPV